MSPDTFSQTKGNTSCQVYAPPSGHTPMLLCLCTLLKPSSNLQVFTSYYGVTSHDMLRVISAVYEKKKLLFLPTAAKTPVASCWRWFIAEVVFGTGGLEESEEGKYNLWLALTHGKYNSIPWHHKGLLPEFPISKYNVWKVQQGTTGWRIKLFKKFGVVAGGKMCCQKGFSTAYSFSLFLQTILLPLLKRYCIEAGSRSQSAGNQQELLLPFPVPLSFTIGYSLS